MPLRLAAAAASLLARTEKPIMAALKPSASVTSDSEMPPTPACRMRAATSSVPSFSSDPRIASSEPCTSALTRSEEHTSELQSRGHLVCRLLLEKKNKAYKMTRNQNQHLSV